MEVERVVGVRSQEPVEYEPGVAAGRTGAILIPGPFAIDVDQVNSSSCIRPSTRHAFQSRTGHIRDRQDRTRHLGRIELVHDGVYRVHRADLITVYTAGQNDAL